MVKGRDRLKSPDEIRRAQFQAMPLLVTNLFALAIRLAG